MIYLRNSISDPGFKEFHAMTMMEKLNAMRSHGGAIQTFGLDDETVLRFAENDPRDAT